MKSKILNYLFKSYHRPSAKILHIFALIQKLFFNKKTKIFSEKMFLLKFPPNSVIYLNFFGRMVYLFLNFLSIIFFNKFLHDSIFIDNGNLKNNSLIKDKNDHIWPPQSIKFKENSNIKLEKFFCDKLEENYKFNLELLSKSAILKDSPWWISIREEYQKLFLNSDKKINLTALENFRSNIKTKSAIISEPSYLKGNDRINKIKSLSLLNLYHKTSEHVDLEILRKVSESHVGKNNCLNYRNQRLSHTLLRHSYFCSQILSHTKLDRNEKNVIFDLGGGYGSLSRLLKYIYKKSTIIIIEIPEACILSTFFLKKNFPNSKIGQALDFKNIENIKKQDLTNFDFVVLPQPFIEKLESDMINLSINTISLGEMTNETQNYYINHIERITKDYFYSVNRPSKRVEKYNAQGFYDWNFSKTWDTKIYNFSPTYHIEFLGKKEID